MSKIFGCTLKEWAYSIFTYLGLIAIGWLMVMGEDKPKENKSNKHKHSKECVEKCEEREKQKKEE